MKFKPYKIKESLLAVLVVGLCACAVPAMHLDGSFRESADAFAVSGRQGLMLKQQISFGEFSTGIIDRDWDTTSSVELMGVRSQQQRSGFRFNVLQAGENIAQVNCGAGGDQTQVDASPILGDNARWIVDAEAFLDCSVLEWGATQNWQLQLYRSLEDQGLRGYYFPLGLESSEVYEVLATTELENGWRIGEAVGFLIFSQARQIAAVQMMGDGGVWLDRGLNAGDRQRLATLSAILLAYRPVE